jgi:hypothetical protein
MLIVNDGLRSFCRACKTFSLLRLYDLAVQASSRVVFPFRTSPLPAMGIQIVHYVLCMSDSVRKIVIAERLGHLSFECVVARIPRKFQ